MTDQEVSLIDMITAVLPDDIAVRAYYTAVKKLSYLDFTVELHHKRCHCCVVM